MKIKPIIDKLDIDRYLDLPRRIYKNNNFRRLTEDDIVELIVKGNKNFESHAKVISFIIETNNQLAGRFTLILDHLLNNIVQVAFMELEPGLDNIVEEIKKIARKNFPNCSKIAFGLNGHLNYGTGYMLNKFEEVPSFGLQYTQEYYVDYFRSIKPRIITTFIFEINRKIDFKGNLHKYKRKGYSIRAIDKSRLKEEAKIYTRLSNIGFKNHPYWADRMPEEDFELFDSYKYLFQSENLLLAEYNNTPVGFLLWFPDFNQLVGPNTILEANYENSKDLIRLKEDNFVNRFRFAEIAIIEEHRKKGVELMLINRMIEEVSKFGYRFCEGGFIFEENLDSINLAKRYMERVLGIKMAEGRKYAVYEDNL